MIRVALACLMCALPQIAFSTPVFGPQVDSSQFRVTLFASGLSVPQAMQQLSDGSILVQHSPGYSGGALVRFTDTNGDGVGVMDPGALFTAPNTQGPLTQLVTAGDYFIQGTFGDHTISFLRAGAAPGDALTDAGALQFTFPGGWWHSSAGLAARATPGGPAGSFDLVFNVGSAGDTTAGGPVTLNGLGLTNQPLDGGSLYMVTLDLSGANPSASNLRQIATGTRNVFGLQFDGNGDLWFSDNGIDAAGPDQDPEQADELNRITAAQLQPGSPVLNFGFPTCFPDYTTGVHAAGPCIHPEEAFIPLLGPGGLMYSQGAAQIALAPSGFPAPFSGGIFIGFSGIQGNTRNPVIYYDPATGQYQYFVMGGSMANPLGLLATSNSLFISDWGAGEIYQITSLAPEPAGFAMAALGLLALGALRLRKAA